MPERNDMREGPRRDNTLGRRRPFLRKVMRLLPNPAAMALGALGVLGGLRVFVDPASSPVALASPRIVALAWGVLYALGGFCIMLGVIRGRNNTEAAGWVAFSTGAFVQALFTLNLLDTNPLLTVYSLFSLTLFGLFGLAKAFILKAGYRLVWVSATVTVQGGGDDAGS